MEFETGSEQSLRLNISIIVDGKDPVVLMISSPLTDSPGFRGKGFIGIANREHDLIRTRNVTRKFAHKEANVSGLANLKNPSFPLRLGSVCVFMAGFDRN